ncbi:MAG: DUF1730 domain-containing protein [Oscillospiraceae bacterium]|nr:DUF1730 domain-containing protein [Oscillospiraceae bacterium]
MPQKKMALDCLLQSGIPVCGGCRFEEKLIIPGVRSASRLPQNAKSVLVGLFPYYVGAKKANLSLYSVIADYHDVAGRMLDTACEKLKELFPQHSFVPFVDASPIAEVAVALKSGLGKLGRNGQLITEKYGSMTFIGEIVTDLDLGFDDCETEQCENCGKCIAACPTGALSESGFCKDICRSHFSQKKGELTEWETNQLKSGGLAWGCDICTLACPHNASPEITPITEFTADIQPELTEKNIEILMKNRAFAWRGEKVLRRNLSILKDK